MFALDCFYTRREIHDLVGGDLQGMLPTRVSKVVACCVKPEVDRLLEEGVLLIGKRFEKRFPVASDWADGRYPVPLFRKQRTNAWRYCGDFRVRGDRSRAAIEKYKQLARDEDTDLVLFLEPVGPISRVVPICCKRVELTWPEALNGLTPTESELFDLERRFRNQGYIPQKEPTKDGLRLLESPRETLTLIIKAVRAEMPSAELLAPEVSCMEKDPFRVQVAIAVRDGFGGTTYTYVRYLEAGGIWQASDGRVAKIVRNANGTVRLRLIRPAHP